MNTTHAPTSPTADPEFTLTSGTQSALVGAFGGSLRRYWITDDTGPWDVVWGYAGRDNKIAGQGDVLMPFPSRLKHGRYTFGGQSHQLDLTDKEGPNAIHGFLRNARWTADEVTTSRATFAARLRPGDYAGYPFAIDVNVTYALTAGGLRTSFTMTNVGDEPGPVGAGFHPYFTLDDGPIDPWIASFPAAEYLEFKDLVPTGKILSVEGTPLDYRRPRVIGSNRFNFCFQRLDRDANGWATARLSRADGRRAITLRFDRAFKYLVVYSGEAIPAPHARRAFAIEPLTCATDAFNHPDWGLTVLAPGETLTGAYEIDPSGAS